MRNWNDAVDMTSHPAQGTSIDELDLIDLKLAKSKETLQHSGAYKWLVSTIQRQARTMDMQAGCMDRHRDWLLALLGMARSEEQTAKASEIRRRRQPPTFTADIRLDWDIMGFIRFQEYSRLDLEYAISRSITLSGDGHFVQALPCLEYMEQTWPYTGPALCRLFDDLVQDPHRRHHCKSSGHYKLLSCSQTNVNLTNHSRCATR